MSRRQTLTIAVVVALVGMAAFPMAASAATDLSVDVDQSPDTGDATVAVTDNGTAVENATVNVTSDSAYEGTGEYETDANGTVTLDNPNETVTVTISVTKDNASTSSEVELVPLEESLDVSAEQGEDGNATVTVTQYDDPVENATVNVTSDDAYEGTGEYETNENGTATLPNPNETVEVNISASANGVSATTSAELVPYEDSLDVTADQAEDGTVTIEVTQYDDPVENATVDVESDGDLNGTYTTDENGTVTFEQPTFDQTISVTATVDDLTAETTAQIDGSAQLEVGAEQRSDGVFVTVDYGGEPVENATVDVAADGDYSGTGTYETDESGEVVLPLPEENVTITVNATVENETASTTTELTVEFVEEQGPFGQAVSMFVSALQGATFDGPPGQIISDFVTSNNPGNADEAAGNGANADDGNETDDAPGQSGEAPGQSGDAPGQSGNGAGNAQGGADEAPGQSDAGDGSDGAPGQSGEAPGQSDDENETDTRGNGNGNAPAGDEDRGGPDDAGDDDSEESEAENDEEDDADTEDEEDDADSEDGAGNAGGNGGSGGGPGNSGNAPVGN